MTDQIITAALWPRTTLFMVSAYSQAPDGPIGDIEKKMALATLASQAAGAFAGHKLYGGALAIYAGGAVGTLAAPLVMIALVKLMGSK